MTVVSVLFDRMKECIIQRKGKTELMCEHRPGPGMERREDIFPVDVVSLLCTERYMHHECETSPLSIITRKYC